MTESFTTTVQNDQANSSNIDIFLKSQIILNASS